MHVCVLTRTLAGTRTLTSPGPGLSYSLGVPLVALGTQMAVLGSGLGIGSHSLNSTGLGKQMVELALGTTGVVAFGLKRFEGSITSEKKLTAPESSRPPVLTLVFPSCRYQLPKAVSSPSGFSPLELKSPRNGMVACSAAPGVS